jgi:hypothetical protein
MAMSESTSMIPSLDVPQLLSVRDICLDENGPKVPEHRANKVLQMVLEDGIDGFDHPLIVRKLNSTESTKHYEIVDGKARWICAVALGIKTVSAIIVSDGAVWYH